MVIRNNRTSYAKRRAYFLVREAQERAIRKQLPFDLWDHFALLEERLDRGVCEASGLPFSLAYDGLTPLSPSIDRIEPATGYVYGNIRVIAWSLNAAFGSWGEDQFERIATAWLANRKDN